MKLLGYAGRRLKLSLIFQNGVPVDNQVDKAFTIFQIKGVHYAKYEVFHEGFFL